MVEIKASAEMIMSQEPHKTLAERVLVHLFAQQV